MGRQLFQDLVVSNVHSLGSRRARGLPVSLMLHGAAVLGLVSLSLADHDALPEPPPWSGRVVYAAPRPPSGGASTVVPPKGLQQPRRVSARPVLTIPVDSAETQVPEPDTWPPGDVPVDVCLPGQDCVPGWVGSENPEGDLPPAVPEPPPALPARAGVDVTPPRKIKDVAPVYPDLAQRVGVEGIVIIECVIAPNGRVADARVLRGHPLLDQAALDALSQWVYAPTRVMGAPVAVVMTVTVNFHLKR